MAADRSKDEGKTVVGAEPTPMDKVAAEGDLSETDAETLAKAGGKTRSVNARPARMALDSDDTPRTLLDSQVDMPGFVAPGDGPFDTVDPSEHATSVSPDKGNAALAGFGVVNAVLPVPDPSGREQALAKAAELQGSGDGGRVETYTQTGPDGKPVTIKHNIDTGTTERA